MTASGFVTRRRRSPVSLGAAFAIQGVILAGLLTMAPEIVINGREAITMVKIRPEVIPPENVTPPPKAEIKPPISHIDTPRPIIDPPVPDSFTLPTTPPTPLPLGPIAGSGTSPPLPVDPPKPDPVMVGAQPDPRFAATVQHRLTEILSRLATVQAGLSSDATDFWQRSIVEAFAETALRALPPQREHPVRSYPSLVREVERYLDERADRPVHVSEICSALNVSRRALHRAFDDVLGAGPVAYFRRKRLHAVYSALRQAQGRPLMVTDVAMEHGFTDLGRFGQAYKALFGETPSQTLRHNPG